MKDRTGKELSTQEIVRKGGGRVMAVIEELDVFLLHLVGLIPSHFLRRFFYRLDGIKIGKGSTIHMGARFYNPHNIEIGEDTIVGENSTLDGRGKIKIGSHTSIASEVMIYNAEHDIHDPDFTPRIEDVEIGDYCFIGPRAIILPGVKIGNGSVVGAGAVVTKDVGDKKVVGGVPAKEIGERKLKDLIYKIGRAAWFR